MKENILKNWKTSLLGLVTAAGMVLVLIALITPDEKAQIEEGAAIIVTHVETIIASVVAIIGTVSGIVNIFRAKDEG